MSLSTSHTRTLNKVHRGGACTGCRRKQSKCDGFEPCHRCLKLKQGHQCLYDKNRLPKLKHRLETKTRQLGIRLHELEHDEDPSASTVTTTPQDCLHGVAPCMWFPDLASTLPDRPTDLTPGTFRGHHDNLDAINSFNVNPSVPGPEQPTVFLIDAFYCHRFQWNYYRDLTPFCSPFLDPEILPHPSLQNAISLVTSSYSPQWIASTHFLAKTIETTYQGIVQGDDLFLDVIQASCLLATYFYTRNKFPEGYYHSTAAAQLATKRLLKTSPLEAFLGQHNAVETLCQLISVDRGWSVVTGLPSALRDEDFWVGYSQITPWSLDELQEFKQSLEECYADGFSTTCESVPTQLWNQTVNIRVGACAAYEMSHRIATKLSEDPSDEHSWSNFSQLQCTLRSFTSVIPPFKKRAGGHLDSLDSHLIAIHTFVHCCSINLEKNLIMTNADSLKTCLLAVDSITAIVQQLSEDEFIYVDVLLSSCWFTAAQTCLQVISLSSMSSPHFIQIYLNYLIAALKRLGEVFPVADFQAREIEAAWSACSFSP